MGQNHHDRQKGKRYRKERIVIVSIVYNAFKKKLEKKREKKEREK